MASEKQTADADRTGSELEIDRANQTRILTEGTLEGLVDQQYVIQPVDTLRVKFRRHAARLAWTTPASVALTILLTLVSTDHFDSTFGIDEKAWKGLFIFAFFAAIAWLLWAVVRRYEPAKSHGSLLNRILSGRGPKTMDGAIETFIQDVRGPDDVSVRLAGPVSRAPDSNHPRIRNRGSLLPLRRADHFGCTNRLCRPATAVVSAFGMCRPRASPS